MNYILGIDIGTSSCKCTLLAHDGVPIATRSRELKTVIGTDGTVEQNPNDWYRALIECLADFKNLDDINLQRVVAVSATGQMQGITLIGKDGEPVRPSILWNDTRSEPYANELNREFEDVFRRNITFACSPSLTVSKIAWLKAEEPESWNKTHKFTFASNFITYKLTGNITADQNNIILSGLNDTKNNDWSEELITCCAVDRDKVPELTGCFDQIGSVTPKAALETGLPAGTPVIAGGGDGATEGYSVGLAWSDRLKIRLGTAADIGMVLSIDKVDQQREIWPGPRDVTANGLLISNYTKACAGSIRWIRDVFYSEQPASTNAYMLMDKEAQQVEPGSGGLIYHPYLSGEHAPYFNNHLRAKFTGMNLGHRREHFVRAGYEGVSFSIRDVIESISYFEQAKEYVFVGGGTKSKLWMSIIVDILGKDGRVPQHCDASFGVALMAGHAVKQFDSVEVIESMMSNATYVPFNEQNHNRYSEVYDKYKELAGK